MERKLKVYGYVIRERSGHRQVLVFDHVDEPDAGTQVPGGSVEEGESLEQAVLREVGEEAGLNGLTILGEAGVYQWPVPERRQIQERHCFHLSAPPEPPEEWVHTVSGGTEDKGLRFRFYWMDLREAARLLAGEQGSQLPPLFENRQPLFAGQVGDLTVVSPFPTTPAPA